MDQKSAIGGPFCYSMPKSERSAHYLQMGWYQREIIS